MFFDRLGHARKEWSGVANARRATKANQVEAEGFQVAHQVGALEVVDHDSRTGSERRLHPWLGRKTSLMGLFCHESSSDEH